MKTVKTKESATNLDATTVMKALSETNRVNILKQLQTGRKCVCELVENQSLSQNLISHHLKILREAGVVTSYKEGVWTYYEIAGKTIDNLINALEEMKVSHE